jgi:hypothetical protein
MMKNGETFSLEIIFLDQKLQFFILRPKRVIPSWRTFCSSNHEIFVLFFFRESFVAFLDPDPDPDLKTQRPN